MNQLITTKDGSHTIYVPELNEHYHSIHGAVQESEYIFIRNGFSYCQADPLNILEIGFGTGLNALLTAINSKSGTRDVNYTTLEKYPLTAQLTDLLNYHEFAGEDGKEIFDKIHSAVWNERVTVCNHFKINKIETDLIDFNLSGRYDLIYFDAFGPDKQPEMWTKNIFDRIASVTKKNGLFLTYSAKGEVKRNLKSCGFEVTLLPGPPGKRQIIRAVKI